MRVYYNERLGAPGDTPKLNQAAVRRRVYAAYSDLCRGNYLQKSFGYYCVDAGAVPGEAGTDMADHFYLLTGIAIEGTLEKFLEASSDIALFTFIEFVHDHVAKPDARTGRQHAYMNCGMHYDHWSSDFDVRAAQADWRAKMNAVLPYYLDGFSVTSAGDVVHTAPNGLAELLALAPPPTTSDINKAKLVNAIKVFHKGLASRAERKQAIRDLVDLLEFHRAEVKTQLLKKDESDLFAIANNFALRHHRAEQRDDYDDIWLSWLFYLYLSAVHLVLALVHRQAEISAPSTVADDNDVPF